MENKNDNDNKVLIQVPSTRFWVSGTKETDGYWTLHLIDPAKNRKSLLRSKVTPHSFSLFASLILKHPLPASGKETNNIESGTKKSLLGLILGLILLVPFSVAHGQYDPNYPGSITNPLQVQVTDPLNDPTVNYYSQALRDQQLRIRQQSDALRLQQQLQIQQQQNNYSQQRQKELDNLNKANADLQKNIQNFQNSAGSSVPSGYQCAFDGNNTSRYFNSAAKAYTNITTEINNYEKTNGTTSNSSTLMSLYVYKGQVSGSYGQYVTDCANIDKTIAYYSGETSQSPYYKGGTPQSAWANKVQQIAQQVCQQTYGINASYTGETDRSKGGGPGGCACGTGFQFNKKGTQCVAITTEPAACPSDTFLKGNSCITHTDDCRAFFGTNVSGSVDPNNANGSTCSCEAGYKWNITKTTCVPVSEKSNNQLCQDVAGANSVYTGIYDVNIIGSVGGCGCKAGSKWNSIGTACEVSAINDNQSEIKSKVTFTSTLRIGSSGDEVSALQGILAGLGFFTGKATGYFGSKTMAAVSAYQQQKGIQSTGLVGPLTRAILNQN